MGQRGYSGAGAAQPLATTLALVLGVWLLGADGVEADFFTQVFAPACPPLRDPGAKPGFLRWSSPETWHKLGPRVRGGIPGVGPGTSANVSIPCGVAVLLDVPSVRLTHLNVKGLLRVEDPWPRLRVYQVRACFITVQGQLQVGSAAHHFRSKLTVTLAPNPYNRLPLTISAPAYSNRTRLGRLVPRPVQVGHKAFAVVGGQVELHGMPGGGSTPSWVRLSRTARKGQRVLQVQGRVESTWAPGASLALASTDFFPAHAERLTIASVVAAGERHTWVRLKERLKWNHLGDPRGVSDGLGGAVHQRAEVALLSRNIVVAGADEPGEARFEGGHFVVHQTPGPQAVHGVEFWRMGQQGRLGRYSIHWHVCGDTQGKSVVRKNAIHDSHQRCIVVHATHNLTLDSNVAFNTSGHCFMTEEGGERDNLFVRNLGMLTLPVKRPIQASETDRQPATFWITNLNNHLRQNCAAGSASSGIWIELRSRVRGMSLLIPDLAAIRPLFDGPGGACEGNTVHSNWGFGLRSYPKGIQPKDRPLYDSHQDPIQDRPSLNYTISRLLAYKHRRMGVFLQSSGGVQVVGSTLADNAYGVYVLANTGGAISGSRFVGATSNIGTPPPLSACRSADGPILCAPIMGCKFPPTTASNVREAGRSSWRGPSFGVLITGAKYHMHASPSVRVIGNKFSKYDPSCKPAAGVGLGLGTSADWWDAATSIQGSLTAPGTSTLWMPPRKYTMPGAPSAWRAGDALTRDLVVRDTDGTLVGAKRGGYVVANFSFLLPAPLPHALSPCMALPASQAYACPGLCYRTLFIEYSEPGFTPFQKEAGPDPARKRHGDFSFLKLVRSIDKASRAVDGNLQVTEANGGAGPRRWFYVTLQAGPTYNLYIQPGRTNASFWPDRLLLAYADGWGGQEPCRSAPVSLRVMPGRGRQGVQWQVDSGPGVFWSKCPGVSVARAATPWAASFQYACYNGVRVLQLRLDPSLPLRQPVSVRPSGGPVLPCNKSLTRCGVLAPGSWYRFTAASSAPLGPAPPQPLAFRSLSLDDTHWAQGRGALELGPKPGRRSARGASTREDARTTFYLRHTFTVSHLQCYSGLVLQYYPSMAAGLVAHLNEVELFRSGPPSATPAATLGTNWSSQHASAELASSPVIRLELLKPGSGRPALRRGPNVMAFEVQLHRPQSNSWLFDATLSLLYRC